MLAILNSTEPQRSLGEKKTQEKKKIRSYSRVEMDFQQAAPMRHFRNSSRNEIKEKATKFKNFIPRWTTRLVR